ncbi:MAG: hypothetical protein IJ881_03350 [Neisseriaceae bacterium]|nr:hypothetical protein [Neisseriaceae bacterium]
MGWLTEAQQYAQNAKNGAINNAENGATGNESGYSHNGGFDSQSASDAFTVGTAAVGSTDAINTTVTGKPATGVVGGASKAVGVVSAGANAASAVNNFSEGNITSGVYDTVSTVADGVTVVQPEWAPVTVPVSMGSQVLKRQHEEHQAEMEQREQELQKMEDWQKLQEEYGNEYGLEFDNPLLGKLFDLDYQDASKNKSPMGKLREQNNVLKDLENGKYGGHSTEKDRKPVETQEQSDDRNWFQKLIDKLRGKDHDDNNNANANANEKKSQD